MNFDEILSLPVFEPDAAVLQALRCDEPDEPGMYFYLSHGRKEPDQDMDDWGSSGPYFGPLQDFQMVYLSGPTLTVGDTRVDCVSPVVYAEGEKYHGAMFPWGDTIYFDGVFYGVMGVTYHGGGGR